MVSRVLDRLDNGAQEFVMPDLQFSFQAFGSHVKRVGPTWCYPNHEHRWFEINVVLEGSQVIQFPTRAYTLHSGDLLFIRPREPHQCRAMTDEQMTYFCLHFDVSDRDLFHVLESLPETFYPSDTELSIALRPILGGLLQEIHAPEFQMQNKLAVQIWLFRMFAVLAEHAIQYADWRAPHGASIDNHALNFTDREQIALEKRVEDLLYEEPSAEFSCEELFPPFHWVIVVSVMSPRAQLTTHASRYIFKDSLAELFGEYGIPVVVTDEHVMTCVTFSNLLLRPDLGEAMQRLIGAVSTSWPHGCRVQLVAVVHQLSDIHHVYQSTVVACNESDGTCVDVLTQLSPFETGHQLIRKAVEIIEAEYDHPHFSLQTLAERLQTSRSYLSSLFRPLTGKTFTQWLHMKRLKEACRLLSETDLKIYEICNRVGYEDPAYFSQFFKAQVGIRPFEYRHKFSSDMVGIKD